MVASDTVGASEYNPERRDRIPRESRQRGPLLRLHETMELRSKAAREHMGELARGDIKEEYELRDCKAKYEHALRAVGSRVM